MTSIVFVLALLQFPASVRASTSSECTVDSCDAFSMMQSRAHASLSAERSTLVGSSAKDKLASLMNTIEHEVVNLKVGDPLPDVVKDSLEIIQTAIEDIQEKVETDLGNQSATLERFATAFQNCMTISTQTWPSIADGANPLQQESDEVSSLKDLHAECRTKEVGDQMRNAVGQDGTCDIFLDAIQTLESIKPSGLKQTELSNFFEHFDETTFSQKATACDSAVKSYTLTVEGCTANQTAYETAVCHWHTSTRLANNACEAIRSCRDVDGKLLEEECAAAQSRSIAWKAEEIAIKQIKCLLEKLFAGEYDKIKTCKDSIPEEGNEDYKITCPTVTTSSEEESKCSNLVKPADIALVPGSDTWITTYSSEGWYDNARTSADTDARITARESCELPPISCPEGTVPNSDNTGCEATTTTTTTTQAPTTTTTEAEEEYCLRMAYDATADVCEKNGYKRITTVEQCMKCAEKFKCDDACGVQTCPTEVEPGWCSGTKYGSEYGHTVTNCFQQGPQTRYNPFCQDDRDGPNSGNCVGDHLPHYPAIAPICLAPR